MNKSRIKLFYIKRVLIALIIVLFFTTELDSCYSPIIYHQVATKALLLMPKALRNVLKLHINELLLGASESASLLNSEDHFLFADNGYGKAHMRIKQISDKIVYDVYHHVPFHIIAREFGYIAHYITDLNNPLHTAKRNYFIVLCEREFNKFYVGNLEKIPFVFYGYSSSYLEKGDIIGFTDSIVQRSLILRERLMGEMCKDDKIIEANKFDEKSIVFGVTAISYQHAISNTVQLWFHIWKNAHGDTKLD